MIQKTKELCNLSFLKEVFWKQIGVTFCGAFFPAKKGILTYNSPPLLTPICSAKVLHKLHNQHNLIKQNNNYNNQLKITKSLSLSFFIIEVIS